MRLKYEDRLPYRYLKTRSAGYDTAWNDVHKTYPLSFPNDVTHPSRQGIVRKVFQSFPFTKPKWRTRILLGVYLSGEECSTQPIMLYSYVLLIIVVGCKANPGCEANNAESRSPIVIRLRMLKS